MSSLPVPEATAFGIRRDRLTIYAYLQMACFAWLMYGFGAANALLRDEQGTSRAVAGLHSTALAVAGILAGLATSRLLTRLGRSGVLHLATFAMAAGLTVYLWPGGGFGASLSGIFLCGWGGTLLVVALNALLQLHHGDAGPVALTEAAAVSSLSAVAGPLVVGIVAGTLLGWRVGVLLAAVPLVTVEVLRSAEQREDPGASSTARQSSHREPLPRTILPALALVVCFVGSEFSLVYWGSDVLRVRAGFAPGTAGLAVAVFAAGMTTGRIVGARLAGGHAGDRILRASIGVALVGFALVWLPEHGLLILMGLFIMGCGMAVHWPLGISRVVAASGGMTDRATAQCAVWGNAAIGGAPFVLGAVSDAAAFQLALLLVPALLATAMAILLRWPVRTA